MKILRILGVLFAFFVLLGVSVSTKSISPPPQRIDSIEEELALKKNYIRDISDAVESAIGLDEVPEWVRAEAIRSVTNTSYANSVKAVTAWRQQAEFTGSVDERVGRIAQRPGPRPPEEPGDAMAAHNWSIDRRVHTEAGGQQFHPAVAVGSDGTIYVTWAHYMDASNSWIYFSKSSDDGESWSSPRSVRTYGINNRPRIAAYGSGSTADVYITYTYWANPSNYDYDIYCAVSNNGGTSFATYTIRASGDYEDLSCVVTDDVGYVYIALSHGWVSGGGCDPSEADTRILMYRSTNRGGTWTGAYSLADYGGQRDNILPALAAQGGGTTATLHFAWTRDVTTTGGNYDVYYKKILNAGGTPVIPSGYITIANTSGQEYVIPGGIGVGPSGNPQIAYMYSTSSTGYGDIYYRRSIDGGNSFLAAVPISNRYTEESDPVIAVDARNNPTIAWRDSRNGNYDIFVRYSDNAGVSWKEDFRANQDVTTSNQYWPGLAMWKSGWQRKIATVWWDERYDDGDIYYNGNHMVGVSLNVSYVPTPPLWPLPQFHYRAFEMAYDTMFTSAATYDIWFDPEYSNDPRLDELWAGSSSNERWAVDNPGGWTWLAGNYWMPPSTGGAYNCPYYRQFRVLFKALKGNPPVCAHTVPNIHLDYESFGNDVHTTINDAIVCTAWVDAFTSYEMDGWFALSPTQRWATISPDTIGTISAPRNVQPYYYHQWKPVILLVGPTVDNWAFTERHTQFGAAHAESNLYNRWEEWTDCGTTVEFSDTTVPHGWYAVDPTEHLCDGYWMRTIRYSNNRQVVIRNDFGFGQVKVDGISVPSPDTVSWGPASVHSIGAITPQSFGDTIRFHWREWSDGGDTVHNVTIPEHDINYTAYFNCMFKLNMEYGGETGGYTPTLTGEGWYWEDSVATITASESWDSAGGVRYGFSHWETVPPGAYISDSTSSTTTIVVDRHYRVRAVYAMQYQLIVNSDGGYGLPDPPIGSNWVNAGAHICAEAGSPDAVHHMYATGWNGTGPVPSTGTGDVACFYMTAPGTITWHWAGQLSLTVISTYGVPSPFTGVHYYDPGAYVSCNVPSPFMLAGDTRAACTGYTGTSVIGSGITNFVDFNIVENCTLVWNWRIEYKLVIVNPAGYGAPIIPPAGENWFPSGSMVMAKVNSPDPPMICTGFIGTPPTLPATSHQDSVVFAMIAPATLTWLWTYESDVVSLTVVSPDGRGAPSPYGTTWWLLGSDINATVTSPWIDPGEPGIRWITTGHTGTGSAPSGTGSSTGTFYIWTNSTITWNWDNEIRLFIDSEPGYYGSPDPDTGAHWFTGGTSVSGSVTTPWEDSINCVGFTGEGSAPSSSGASSFSFTLDEPSAVRWQWEVSTVSLVVNSDYGTPNPGVGTHHYGVGTDLVLSVNRYHTISATERWKCTGWIGTGSVPASGSDTTVSVRITSNSSIRWLWTRQFRFDVNNPGGWDTPVPPVGQHWFDAGSWVSAYITTNPVDTMFCVGFNGTGDCPSMWGLDDFNFIISQYSTIEWIWMGESSVNRLDVTSEHGSPHPPVGTHYYPIGVSVNCYMPDATEMLAPGDRTRCIGYTGTGSTPSGSDTTFAFTIETNSTLTWNWQREFSFQVVNPSGFGAPIPAVGTHWFPAGSGVSARVTINPDGIMVCSGYSGWGSLGTGLGDSVYFVIAEPSGVEWEWEALVDVFELTVISSHGPCDPPIGVSYIPAGVEVTATAGPYEIISDVRRNTAVGWRGTGCVPASGDGNSATFRMTSNGSITWNWESEFHMALDFTGCGSALPVQTGDGWYQTGDIASVTTSTSVADGGIHYGFVQWTGSPDGAFTIAEDRWPNTTAQLFNPCTLIAEYAPAVACTLVKTPAQNYGGFLVDGTLYEGIHEYVDWWALGTNHTIGATSPDTGFGEKHEFSRWSDGGDRIHTIGPVAGPMKLTAYYLTQYRLSIEKSPLQSHGSITVDATEYPSTGNIDLWFSAGAAPTVGVSPADYASSQHRYNWTAWSDSGALNHALEPMDGPVDLIAYYDEENRLRVTKNPAQSYGWIKIDETHFELTSSAEKWFVPGGTHEVRVSRVDVYSDSAYQFFCFGSDMADSVIPRTVLLDDPVDLMARYRGFEYDLWINVDPVIWNLGLLIPSYTRTMTPPEKITVTNAGNIACDLGLMGIDSLSTWVFGATSSMDRVVVRGHFNNNPVPPAIFHTIWDCIHTTINWSTDVFYGPLGHGMEPTQSTTLWLQLQMPRATSDRTEQTLIVKVMARVSLY